MGVTDFNDMELDAIGEIMNISLGASATAVSTMLGTKTNITTPVVRVLTSDEFEFKKLEPAVGVEIAYVEGLMGNNVMMFRRNDVRIIVGMLMGGEIPEEEFELNEIYVSAICEVMNQMMGSSATALSEFLGTPVNISTPVSFPIEDEQSFKEKYFASKEKMVVVRFSLEIQDKLESEFLNIMSSDLAKLLLAPFQISLDAETQSQEDARKVAEEKAAAQAQTEPEPAGGMMTQQQIEELMASQAQQPTPTPEPAGGMMTQQQIEELMASQAQQQPTPAPAPEPSGGMMTQQQIEELMASQAQQQPSPTPEPSGGKMTQQQIEELMASQAGQSAAQPAGQPVPAAQTAGQPVQAAPPQGYAPQMVPMGQPAIYQAAPDPLMVQLLNQMQQSQLQMMELMKDMRVKEKEKPARENVLIQPMNSAPLKEVTVEGMEERANQEMLMKVPLELSVEVGRTKKLVKDILELTQGSLVVLDKMAGEQADLFVNGQCVARGDIVVVEDNFGIRITEIVARDLNPEIL